MLFGAVDETGNMRVFFTKAKLETITKLVATFETENKTHTINELKKFIEHSRVSITEQPLMLEQIFMGFKKIDSEES